MNEHAVACTLTLLHPEPHAPEPGLFRSTLEPAPPADVAITLFMAWLGSVPVWVLAWALLAS
jgi:hypothetical protein